MTTQRTNSALATVAQHSILAIAAASLFAVPSFAQQNQQQEQNQQQQQEQEQQPQQTSVQLDDTQIKQRIEQEIKQHDVPAAQKQADQIDVTVKDGVVTLAGSVPTYETKQHAIMRVKQVRGVEEVKDELEIKWANIADLDQKAITKDVQLKLSEQIPAAENIQVKVQENTVTLTGNLESWQRKDKATQVASNVPGVVKVQNNIKVAVAERSDDEIRNAIMENWRSLRNVNETELELVVKDQVAQIRGEVANLPAKDAAIDAAKVKGVREINSDELDVNYELTAIAKAPGETEQGMSDDQITVAVQQGLDNNPLVDEAQVTVQTINGVVTLDGRVQTQAAKEAAEENAYARAGVTKVVNNLKVDPNSDHPLAAEERLKAAEIEAVEKEQPPIAEKGIQTSIAQLKRDPVITDNGIDVQQNGETVILFGVVASEEAREAVENRAADMPGVRKIDNNIQIMDAGEQLTDAEIKDGIESEYFWSIFVDGGDIDIEVQDGIAHLTGEVDSREEWLSAMENAYEGGARKVVNELVIAGFPDAEQVRVDDEQDFASEAVVDEPN